jgi:hypothetical protein
MTVELVDWCGKVRAVCKRASSMGEAALVLGEEAKKLALRPGQYGFRFKGLDVSERDGVNLQRR